MRKSLKQLKQIFADNKEYFIRCTPMTVIAALILGLAIGFAVPASAEASSTIIEAGTYRWSESLTDYPFTNSDNITVDIVGTCYGVNNSFAIAETEYSAIYVGVLEGGERIMNFEQTLEDFTPAIYSYISGWDFLPYFAESIGVTISGDLSLLRLFTVDNDTEVDDTFATWFYANTTNVGDVYPDPDPVIEAGYYKARDTITISGWNVTNDSIEIRYYSQFSQGYLDVEGIAFLIENDIVEIYYQEVAVYTDGWGFDSDKYIEVTQDITVEPEFYTVFNNVYETSSQGSNEFESGFAAGYNDGFSAGRDVGYNQGYYEGMAESSGNFFTDILGGVLGSLDSFTLFGGYSLLDLITTLLGGFALIWILKLLAGG